MEGVYNGWKQVKKLLKEGFAEKARSEWESGMSTAEIAEKHNLRESVVKKVISYDQVYNDFEKM